MFTIADPACHWQQPPLEGQWDPLQRGSSTQPAALGTVGEPAAWAGSKRYSSKAAACSGQPFKGCPVKLPLIHHQLRLPRAGGREASPGALKPGAKQSQPGGRERGHSCPLCSASPPCCPMLIKCFSQLKVWSLLLRQGRLQGWGSREEPFACSTTGAGYQESLKQHLVYHPAPLARAHHSEGSEQHPSLPRVSSSPHTGGSPGETGAPRGAPSTPQPQQGSSCSGPQPMDHSIRAISDQLLDTGTSCHWDSTLWAGGSSSRSTPALWPSQGMDL